MQDCDTSFPHHVERSDKKEIQMIDGKISPVSKDILIKMCGEKKSPGRKNPRRKKGSVENL